MVITLLLVACRGELQELSGSSVQGGGAPHTM